MLKFLKNIFTPSNKPSKKIIDIYKENLENLRSDIKYLNLEIAKISNLLKTLIKNVSELESKFNLFIQPSPEQLIPKQPQTPKYEIQYIHETQNYSLDQIIRLSFDNETQKLTISKNGIFIAMRIKENIYWCSISPEYLMKGNISAFRDVFEIDQGDEFIPVEPAVLKKISDNQFQILKKGKLKYR
jgi:hypothetical protein